MDVAGMLGLETCSARGLLGIALSAVAFRFLYYAIVRPLAHAILPAKSPYGGGKVDVLPLWKNTAVSFVHAILASIGSVYLFTSEPELLDDLIHNGTSDLAPKLLALSTGYFWADTFDMLRGRLFFNSPSIYLHHGIILVTFTLSVHLCVFAPYLIGTLLVEINNINLQLRGLLRQSGVANDSLWYRLNTALLFATYFPCRVAPHVYLLYRVVLDYGAFPSIYSWSSAFLGLLIMNIYNMHLLQSLVHSELRPKSAKRVDKNH